MKDAEALLLDTDVFSYLLNEKSAYASLYKRDVERKRIAVSFVTVGELLYGAEKRIGEPAAGTMMAQAKLDDSSSGG
ncbi:MAG: hypothetical protein HYX27_05105 [Acidobacteria bacterium]|nr:hypothetical protein [Acidobacteriota bacterium]